MLIIDQLEGCLQPININLELILFMPAIAVTIKYEPRLEVWNVPLPGVKVEKLFKIWETHGNIHFEHVVQLYDSIVSIKNLLLNCLLRQWAVSKHNVIKWLLLESYLVAPDFVQLIHQFVGRITLWLVELVTQVQVDHLVVVVRINRVLLILALLEERVLFLLVQHDLSVVLELNVVSVVPVSHSIYQS